MTLEQHWWLQTKEKKSNLVLNWDVVGHFTGRHHRDNAYWMESVRKLTGNASTSTFSVLKPVENIFKICMNMNIGCSTFVAWSRINIEKKQNGWSCFSCWSLEQLVLVTDYYSEQFSPLIHEIKKIHYFSYSYLKCVKHSKECFQLLLS